MTYSAGYRDGFRDASDDGIPEDFSMQAVVDAVEAAGFPAYVEMTGGWVATIYAGEGNEIAAGPGSYRPDEGHPANVDEFFIGLKDSEGAEWTATREDTVDTIAAEIVRQILEIA